MISWARFAGRSGKGATFHAFDTARRGWRLALCGKWAKEAMLAKDEMPGQRCRTCAQILAREQAGKRDYSGHH